jgi:hypothetical protein
MPVVAQYAIHLEFVFMIVVLPEPRVGILSTRSIIEMTGDGKLVRQGWTVTTDQLVG